MRWNSFHAEEIRCTNKWQTTGTSEELTKAKEL